MKLQLDGRQFRPQRVFCIGRNYAAHVAELDNELPDAPVVFLKPAQSLVPLGARVPIPRHGGGLQQEAELVLLLGRDRNPSSESDAWDLVAGVSLGFDLTLRELQSRLKREGLPWEAAKAFEASAPVGSFVPVTALQNRDRIQFECSVNGELRQQADTALMLFPVPRLLVELGRIWRLRAGDLVFTGTPAGVGSLAAGDRIEVSSAQIGSFAWDLYDDQIEPSVGSK